MFCVRYMQDQGSRSFNAVVDFVRKCVAARFSRKTGYACLVQFSALCGLSGSVGMFVLVLGNLCSVADIFAASFRREVCFVPYVCAEIVETVGVEVGSRSSTFRLYEG